jgi:single-stranded-DNA-specific exonuclease
MVDALQSCSKYLESFGGHVQAAGFTLKKENKDLFVHSMQVYAREFLANSNTQQSIQIDTELVYGEINLNLIEQVDTIRPYGMKNERPTFLIKGVSMHNMRQVGHDKSHLLGKLRLDTADYKFIAFSICDKIPHIPEYTRADIVCHIDKNTYNGHTNLEIQLIDLILT